MRIHLTVFNLKLTLKLRVSVLNVIAFLKPYGLAQPAHGSSKLIYRYTYKLQCLVQCNEFFHFFYDEQHIRFQ